MKKFFCLMILVGLGFSCKKKTTSSSSQNQTYASQNGAGGYKSVSGVMQARKASLPSLTVTSYESMAAFHSGAKPLSSFYTMGEIVSDDNMYAGPLLINSREMLFGAGSGRSNIYRDTLNSRSYGDVEWVLPPTGKIFSPFSAKVERGFPMVSNPNYLPSTVSKSSGLTVNLSTAGYSNTDSIIVMVYAKGSGPVVAKHLSGNATGVTFTAGELGSIPTGTGEIYVYGINYSHLSVGFSRYIYIMQQDIASQVIINP